MLLLRYHGCMPYPRNCFILFYIIRSTRSDQPVAWRCSMTSFMLTTPSMFSMTRQTRLNSSTWQKFKQNMKRYLENMLYNMRSLHRTTLSILNLFQSPSKSKHVKKSSESPYLAKNRTKRSRRRLPGKSLSPGKY